MFFYEKYISKTLGLAKQGTTATICGVDTRTGDQVGTMRRTPTSRPDQETRVVRLQAGMFRDTVAEANPEPKEAKRTTRSSKKAQ